MSSRFNIRYVSSRIPRGGGGPVLLDYFVEGFRFGPSLSVPGPTSTRLSIPSDTNNLSFLDYINTFPNGMPYAIFDGSNSSVISSYDISNIRRNNGITVEFFARAINPTKENGRQNHYFCKSGAILNLDMQTYYANYNMVHLNYYINGVLNWIAGNFNAQIPILPSNALDFRTWIHYAFTIVDDIITYFINGHKMGSLAGVNVNDITTIGFTNCLLNQFQSKAGAFNIAQMAVFDYQRYSDDFDVNTSLLIKEL